MFIEKYFSAPNGNLCFTREQGSRFAKEVADDFNPLHDAEGKRFCIPGDLLFSAFLCRYGVSQHMEFTFSGMVMEDVELILPEAAEELVISDSEGREYLQVKRRGDVSFDQALIENLTRNYVKFSGHTFPHILEPLLADENVMLNPARPMVIYASMSIDLTRLDIENPVVENDNNNLQINGKRGGLDLGFKFIENGEVVGRGLKHMLVSGLKDYDKRVVDAAIDEYNERKRVYFQAST